MGARFAACSRATPPEWKARSRGLCQTDFGISFGYVFRVTLIGFARRLGTPVMIPSYSLSAPPTTTPLGVISYVLNSWLWSLPRSNNVDSKVAAKRERRDIS